MATPRGKVWFSKRREALKLGVEHQGLCAEHQKSVINHQKGWCWGYSINLNFLRSSKKPWVYNDANSVHSIKKASTHSNSHFDALKVLAKSQYFQGLSDFLSHSKTVGPGFKS